VGLKKAPIFEFFASKTRKFDEIHAKKKKIRVSTPKGPFSSHLFATTTKSLKKFDEKMTNNVKLRLG
jgi:hypothetical protein